MRLQQIENQVGIEVRNAQFAMQQNRASVDSARAAVELGRQSLDAEQKKFNLGASTVRFVLQEQTNVAQAQTDELQAIVNYTKSLVDLDHSMGMTLKKNNIEIDKTLLLGTTAR